MSLSVLATPLDAFWSDQNDKLLSQDLFYSDRGSIYDDEWYFKDNPNGGEVKIDFSVFDLPALRIEGVAQVKFNDQFYVLSSKEYAKLSFIDNLRKGNSGRNIAIYQFLIHVMAFLNATEAKVLSSNNLSEFWKSFLVEAFIDGRFVNRVSAPSFSRAFNDIAKSKNELQRAGVFGVFEISLTKKKINSILDEVCKSVLSVSFAEYKKGGSYNFLGLELGQYYMDYLRQVYQEGYLYYLVSRKTIEDSLKLIPGNKYNKNNSRLLNVQVCGLVGQKNGIQGTTEGIVHKDFLKLVQNTAFKHYKKHFESAMSLNEKCIEKLVVKLGLGSRFDAVEVIRILMLQKFHGLEGNKTASKVWKDYLVSLEKTFLDENNLSDMSVSQVYDEMIKIVTEKKLGKKVFLEQFTAWNANIFEQSETKDWKAFKSNLNDVAHAMTNLVVGWLGYRASEFGFPLIAIDTVPNADILDSSHVPFRFKLSWKVPKTHEETKIEREITSQCFQIVAQLNDIFGNTSDEPCLYESTSSKGMKATNKSTGYISFRVRQNWESFITEYQPFNDAVLLDELSQKDKSELTDQENIELARLAKNYDMKSHKYLHLLKTAKEVKRDWERLTVSNFIGDKPQARFKESIKEFIDKGEAKNRQHQSIINKYLSDNTKETLKSGNVALDMKTMKDISEEILEGVRYPSPHAFRHIWAEAVLTRYEGDVGAVIRHQFCHLDGSFFMAYLRDKDARGFLGVAKQRYVNSIVEKILSDSDVIGSEYIGGFARYVQKAKSVTNIISDDGDYKELTHKIRRRIIDIQFNHFAICIPRDGGERRAKCSEQGSINPHNARAEFCLVCTNSIITAGNLKGIWSVVLQPIVKQALNEKAMGFMLKRHLPTLKSGHKRIHELWLKSKKVNKDAVSKILHATETAIKAIEGKLEKEVIIYGKS